MIVIPNFWLPANGLGGNNSLSLNTFPEIAFLLQSKSESFLGGGCRGLGYVSGVTHNLGLNGNTRQNHFDLSQQINKPRSSELISLATSYFWFIPNFHSSVVRESLPESRGILWKLFQLLENINLKKL